MGKAHDKLKKVSLFHRISGGAAGDKAAKDALRASKKAAKGQQAAMAYLQERGKLPSEMHDSALKMLGGIFGLPGFDKVDLTGQSMDSPLYKAMIGQIDQSLADQSQEAGASASAKGQLGSGVLADALAKYRSRSGVDKANALGQVYQQQLQGIGNLSNLNGYDTDIANLIAGKAATEAGGITASNAIAMDTQRNKFAALPGFISSIFGMGGGMGGGKSGGSTGSYTGGSYNTSVPQSLSSQYGGGYTEQMGSPSLSGGGYYFSDIRLKDDIEQIGHYDGHKWYRWKWNENAAKFGLHGDGEGVMAHEVEPYFPDAIGEHEGYMTVDYSKLGVH